MNIVGFDFGTTNSLISIIDGDRSINYLDEEQRPIPSVICYEGARKILGREAKERLSHAGLGVYGNIVKSPKMHLGKESVFVEGVERSPVDMVADVVRHVCQQTMKTRRIDGISGVVVTIPIGMEGHQRSALRNAFRLAGLRVVQFVHEPFAALYGLFRGRDLSSMLRRYDNKLILVFDWGGGTLDLTLCRLQGDIIVQLINDGTSEVGGDVFDETIMNRVVQHARNSLKLGDSVDTIQGAESRLMDRCERAKIELSNRSNVQIYVRDFFKEITDVDVDYALERNEFEQIVEPLLDKGFNRIKCILDNVGYSPEQVALCVATGGMSNMPVVSRRLHELFGPERVRFPENSATLIAEGAAWIASDKVGLHLAKNVELVLARNSYLPLVKSRTLMPKEGNVQTDHFHLYCTDPRDGIAKFQICVPQKTGSNVLVNEPRVNLGNITVKVDKYARAFEERLELDIQINDDLVFTAHARSLNQNDGDCCEIHNLEFGLRFPCGDQRAIPKDDPEVASFDGAQNFSAEPGAISVRGNLANREDNSLVPGEFLYSYNPYYFDTDNNPPRYQVHERLYYQPCAVCGRASNDPACLCSATRSG